MPHKVGHKRTLRRPSPLKKPLVKPHSSERWCASCQKPHTTNIHRSHGKDSFKKMHKKH